MPVFLHFGHSKLSAQWSRPVISRICAYGRLDQAGLVPAAARPAKAPAAFAASWRCPNSVLKQSAPAAVLYGREHARMRNLPCARNARNLTRGLSTTEGCPNRPPTSQQLIGSKKRLRTFSTKSSTYILCQQNQKSKAASVGGLFHWGFRSSLHMMVRRPIRFMTGPRSSRPPG
jgi:hypothetical protein